MLVVAAAASFSLAACETDQATGTPQPTNVVSRTIVLDDFESGTVTGWRAVAVGGGRWVAYSKEHPPAPNDPEAFHPEPPQGTFAAMTEADGPGTHILYRDVTLDGRFDLDLTVFYRSFAELASPDTLAHDAPEPNQQFRIDLVRPDGPIDSVADTDVLVNVFRAQPDHPGTLDPTDVRVDVSAWSGQTVRLRIAEVDNQAPLSAGVDNIRFEPLGPGLVDRIELPDTPEAASAVDIALHRLTEAEALTALSARAGQLAAADEFAGAFLVARHGQILLQDAQGLADREAGTPNSLTTQFRLGSMNKMFTAVATLQLVEAGTLSLDDPIGTYLVGYPNQALASKVTVRHLLSHTGGTDDIFGPQFDQHRLQLREHGDYLDLYGSRSLAFEPGSRFVYSNYGYVLLGAIIEAVSGQSYYDYVHDHVFEPAGMTATGSLPESVAVPNRAVGYLRRSPDSPWTSNVSTLPWRGTAAGGGYSTVGDLLRFAEALQAGTLISTASLAQATRPQSEEPYGFGFGLEGEGSLRSYGHSGGAPGMNGELRIYPDLGYVVVSLSNLDPPAASNLVAYLGLRLPNE
jgi:CubicO group peptidase (beta-lactamase class C family)